jgi:hypothetical protein
MQLFFQGDMLWVALKSPINRDNELKMLHFIKEEHQRNPLYDYAGVFVWGVARTPGMIKLEASAQ